MNRRGRFLRNELTHLFYISVGIFLFILFFQPFPLDMLTENNRLLYVTGFGVISFLIASLVLIFLPVVIPKLFKFCERESDRQFILNSVLWILTATAFAFYIRYVGRVHLSLYIMFKVSLVCLLPVIILNILYKNKSLENLIDVLQNQNKSYALQIKEYEISGEDEQIDVFSENKTDKISLKYRNLVLIKSADNYIEIYYLEKDQLEKKLIRNTLKNIEVLLDQRRSFIRCHRTSIVNTLYIDKLVRTYSGHSLKMSCLDEEIPVSRQYLMQVKESITAFE